LVNNQKLSLSQVVILLSRECDKDRCKFSTIGNVYRDRNYMPINLANLSVDDDVEKMSGLFAPRKINPNLLVEKQRQQQHSEPTVVYSDSEDEETWRAVGGRGCCVN